MQDIVAITHNNDDGEIVIAYVPADSKAAEVAGRCTNSYNGSDEFFSPGIAEEIEWIPADGNWSIPLDSRVVAIYYIDVTW